MSMPISYDENLLAEVQQKFDLRTPNIEAIAKVVEHLERGDFDPLHDLTLHLATGVGKTYVMAGLIEYLRRQGMRDVMIVTPSKVVQDKTVQDFQVGSPRFIEGFDVPPRVIIPDDVHHLRMDTLGGESNAEMEPSTIYVFNVQQLFPPKDDGTVAKSGSQEEGRRKVWRHQESNGVLGEQLAALPNLVVMVDEAHLFGKSAEVYRSSLAALDPAATVGLTASPDDEDNIIYTYPLWRAIHDEYVKQPVLVYRKSGYDSEARQLQDAISLLRIKEQAYHAFRATRPDVKPTEPLLFVVCASVEHATEIAETLRGPGFFGDTTAVLQVDSKHDDETTQKRLRDLDLPGSPVKCVVSVDKLREGWDTKRIAVMCTLRAMASTVLTQQVMGRGLRLPFGEITHEEPVDTLDIISHKSFVSLLNDENVLNEFGIGDDGVPEGTDVKKLVEESDETPGGTAVADTEADDTTADDTGTETTTATGTATPTETGTTATTGDGTASTSTGEGERPKVNRHVPEERKFGLGVRQLPDDEPIEEVEMVPVTVSINDDFSGTTFTFPSSVVTQTEAPFNLYDIETETVRAQARRVTDTAEQLERRRLDIDEEGTELTPHQMERVSVRSFQQTTEEVAAELAERVSAMNLYVETTQNVANLHSRIVPEFMAASGITEWTEKAKESAAVLLCDLVSDEGRRQAAMTRPVTTIKPVILPVDQSFSLPFGQEVLPRLDIGEEGQTKSSTGFTPRAYYGPWTKGLFEAAQFDSFSAEYLLAEMFNFDPDVVWWKRLYPHERAVVYYTPRSRYMPDFVVKDIGGVHWIIEGKSERGRDDETVQSKKQAAERVIRELIGHPDFVGQRWGYLIAYESDVEAAQSFADLKRLSATEVMPNQSR